MQLFWRGKVGGGLPRFGVSSDLLDFLNSKYLVEVGICAMHKETV